MFFTNILLRARLIPYIGGTAEKIFFFLLAYVRKGVLYWKRTKQHVFRSTLNRVYMTKKIVFSRMTPATTNGYQHAVQFGHGFTPSYAGHSYSTLEGKFVPSIPAPILGDISGVPSWAYGLRLVDGNPVFLRKEDVRNFPYPEIYFRNGDEYYTEL